MILSAPAPLSESHELELFDCGTPSLDIWLKRRALANGVNGASKTYVLGAAQRVVGYYCLASGALSANEAPGNIRRNMPDPIPMVVLGRLAVDSTWQRRGLGVALLQDAVARTSQAAEILGIRGILVHTIDEAAKAFYERYGFVGSPTQPMTLILSLKRAA
jgi:GNAT superfamily N-acetyltransferase